MSKFDISVGYIPGKENTVADVLSRWAYPASQAFLDISKHGSRQDREDVEEILKEEKLDERNCMWIVLRDAPSTRNRFIRGSPQGVGPPLRVVTRKRDRKTAAVAPVGSRWKIQKWMCTMDLERGRARDLGGP